MRKFFVLFGLALFVLNGCSDNQDKKKKAAKQAFSKAEKKEARTEAFSSEGQPGVEQPKTKLQLTEEKLLEVQNLKEKLKRKKEVLDNKAGKFEADIVSNVAEINAERAKNNIKEFSQAISNAIIEQCLKAMQKAQAYKALSEREAMKTRLAVIELAGTEKQLRLDKTLFEDLDEAQIDELLRQIDFVLNKVKPQAEDFKVTDEETVREPLEKLYEKYIRKDERERERKETEKKRQEEMMRDYYNSAPHPPISVTADGVKNPPAKSALTQNHPPEIVKREAPSIKSVSRSQAATHSAPNEPSLARHDTKPKPSFAFKLEPTEPTNPSTFDSSIPDKLDQCLAALENDNCELAQTHCTHNILIKEFTWIDTALTHCRQRAALDRCHAALDKDSCELAQKVCADAALKDYTWIEMKIKACWQFKEQ